MWARSRCLALAADPLRPSAERASPWRRDFWRPLSLGGAYAGAPSPAFARPRRASPFDEAHRDLRRARTTCIAACLRPLHRLPRTPSFGLMPRLAAQPSLYAKLFVNAHSPSTLSDDARLSPLSGRTAAPPYPAPPRIASRLTLTAPGRCLSPTFATDIRYEHPKIARFLSPWLAPWRPSPRCARSVNPKPSGELRRTALRRPDPRWKRAWRRLSSFSFPHLRPSFVSWGGDEPCAQAGLPCHGFVGREQSRRWSLWRPIPRPASARRRASTERRDRFCRPRVNASGFPDPERLPSTSAPFDRFRGGAPATVPTASPPQAGFRRIFTLLSCSRTEELDPQRGPQAIHLRSRGPRAACQFLQSKRIASTTCWWSEPRIPRWSRPQRSLNCGWPRPLSELSQPRFHGPGASVADHAKAPPAAIARGGSFTPTRSARAPPVANLFPPEAGAASAEDAPSSRGHPQGRLAGPRFRGTRAVQGRLPHPPAKKSAIRRTRGAFHW